MIHPSLLNSKLNRFLREISLHLTSNSVPLRHFTLRSRTQTYFYQRNHLPWLLQSCSCFPLTAENKTGHNKAHNGAHRITSSRISQFQPYRELSFAYPLCPLISISDKALSFCIIRLWPSLEYIWCVSHANVIRYDMSGLLFDMHILSLMCISCTAHPQLLGVVVPRKYQYPCVDP